MPCRRHTPFSFESYSILSHKNSDRGKHEVTVGVEFSEIMATSGYVWAISNMNADQDAKNSWPASEASKAAWSNLQWEYPWRLQRQLNHNRKPTCAALVVPNFTYLQRKQHQSVKANGIQAHAKIGKHTIYPWILRILPCLWSCQYSWNVARSLIAAMFQRRYPTCSDLALFASSAWMLDVKTARAKSIPTDFPSFPASPNWVNSIFSAMRLLYLQCRPKLRKQNQDIQKSNVLKDQTSQKILKPVEGFLLRGVESLGHAGEQTPKCTSGFSDIAFSCLSPRHDLSKPPHRAHSVMPCTKSSAVVPPIVVNLRVQDSFHRLLG